MELIFEHSDCYLLVVLVMPRKKTIKDDKDTNNKKVGRPSGNGLEDTHPRLQPNNFRSQVMVYDTTNEPK